MNRNYMPNNLLSKHRRNVFHDNTLPKKQKRAQAHFPARAPTIDWASLGLWQTTWPIRFSRDDGSLSNPPGRSKTATPLWKKIRIFGITQPIAEHFHLTIRQDGIKVVCPHFIHVFSPFLSTMKTWILSIQKIGKSLNHGSG